MSIGPQQSRTIANILTKSRIQRHGWCLAKLLIILTGNHRICAQVTVKTCYVAPAWSHLPREGQTSRLCRCVRWCPQMKPLPPELLPWLFCCSVLLCCPVLLCMLHAAIRSSWAGGWEGGGVIKKWRHWDKAASVLLNWWAVWTDLIFASSLIHFGKPMQRTKISPDVKGKFAVFSIILDLFREKVLTLLFVLMT